MEVGDNNRSLEIEPKQMQPTGRQVRSDDWHGIYWPKTRYPGERSKAVKKPLFVYPPIAGLALS